MTIDYVTDPYRHTSRFIHDLQSRKYTKITEEHRPMSGEHTDTIFVEIRIEKAHFRTIGVTHMGVPDNLERFER